MGRSEALFEVQRYLSDIGWVTQSPAGGKPIWFRSLESARVDLQREMMLHYGAFRPAGEPGPKSIFDPSEYRITDGITVWRAAWNAQQSALAIRVDGARDPVETAGGKAQSNWPASGWQLRLSATGATCSIAPLDASDNGGSGDPRPRPNNRS